MKQGQQGFPHEVLWIPKQYPDTYLVLERRGLSEEEILSGACWQINVYATDLDGLPDELFTDRTVNWHQQDLGRRGLVAAAGLYVKGRNAFVTALQSDLCQQLFRHPRLQQISKTRVNNRFGRWYRVLLNAVLDFAVDHEIPKVYSPTAREILAGIRKPVCADLFERVYDSVGARYTATRQRAGRAEYWEVAVSKNQKNIVRLEPIQGRPATGKARKTICVFHDIEEDVDTPVSRAACRRNLERMLEFEKAHGVRATYSILGALWKAKAPVIGRSDRHSLGFHSYNHQIEDLNQLPLCRQVDLRVKGYRPPRSQITPELSDYQLSYRNFEWLLSSRSSLGFRGVRLQNGIVKIPAAGDDHPLYTGRMSYEAWESRLLDIVNSSSFVAFGLHDCYASTWIDRYGALLEKLAALGEFSTCDEVMNRVLMESAR